MGAQGKFSAWAVDTEPKMMKEVLKAAALHKGTSVVEILQNCVIFNNQLRVATIGEKGVTLDDILVHDPTTPEDMTHCTL